MSASSNPLPGPLSAGELAALLGGAVEGDPAVRLEGLAGIGEAGPADVTFLANRKYAPALAACRAGAVIVAREQPAPPGLTLIRVDDPYLAFARALARFRPPAVPPPGVDPDARLAPGAVVDPRATVGPFAFVGEGAAVGPRTVLSPFVFVGAGTTVGADCLIHPHVTLREGVRVGDRVIIHSGTVVGSDGYGYARDGERHVKVPQTGGVVLENDVELGACVTVDRGTMGDTRIGEGTKVDNLVQIAHNVSVGPHSLIVAQVGISGSTTLGRGVTIAGQAGITGHLKIGDRVVVAAQSGVMHDVPAHTMVSGSPSRPHREWLERNAVDLPRLRRELRALARRVEELERLAGATADTAAEGANRE